LFYQSTRGFLGRIKIHAYFYGKDVKHVWISENGNLEEKKDHSWCNMVEQSRKRNIIAWRVWERRTMGQNTLKGNTKGLGC
jgi:hypothetical protein